MTVRADVTAFRCLYGVAKHYAGQLDLWSEVQPNELRFHFAVYDIAFSFVAYCLRKKYETNLKSGDVLQSLEELGKMPGPAKYESLFVKRTPEIRTYPMRLELAGFYSEDAADFLRRNRFTVYTDEVYFQGVKSRRSKAYVDLRMALEAMLKATVCLRSPYGLAGKSLVQKIRGYFHHIDWLRRDAKGIGGQKNGDTSAKSPVDLENQFDAMNFRIPMTEIITKTIGSNAWLGDHRRVCRNEYEGPVRPRSAIQDCSRQDSYEELRTSDYR